MAVDHAFFIAAFLLPLTWITTHPNILTGTKQVVENYAGGTSIKEYLLTQTKVMVTYIRLLFLPIHQTVEYDLPLARSIFEMPVILSSLFLLLVLLTAMKLFNKYRLVSFGIFWFFITLLPESSLWPNKDVIFEHRLYLPMMGFGIFLSSGLFYFFEAAGIQAVRVLFLIILVFSIMTYQRNRVWADEFTLWDDAVHQSPRSTVAYLNRGAAYEKHGDLDHALADYNMVVGLGPVDAVTISNRGNIFRNKGAFDLALANFSLAIKINPSFGGTYINRGLLYQTEGKLDLALADFSRAIQSMPNNAAAYMDRGMIYEKNKKLDLAIADYDKGIAIEPNNPVFYGYRASAYFLEREYDKTWEDVHKVEQLGSAVKSQYLADLKKASGRDR